MRKPVDRVKDALLPAPLYLCKAYEYLDKNFPSSKVVLDSMEEGELINYLLAICGQKLMKDARE